MIEIIPAIDIISGECVRLKQGDYSLKTSYFKDPLDAAKMYVDAGLKRLHVVDLDGAKAAKPCNLKVLERISSHTNLDIQYGGGIKNSEALKSVLESGAKRAICGSIAVKSPELFTEWLEEYGAQHIILGADTKNGKIAINGWLEESDVDIVTIIENFKKFGLNQVICTDISKDGMLEGPSFGLYEKLDKQFPLIDITVSGGISSMDDIIRLNDMGLKSVIVGKAIYEEKITMEDIKRWLPKE